MRAALVLLALLLVPLASAQSPEEAVALACDTVGGLDPAARELLPVCARAEPQPPAQEEDAAAPPAPTASPAPVAPQDVEDLAEDVAEEVQRIPEDPAGAPELLLDIIDRVVDFVRDLLGLPGAGLALATEKLDELRADVLGTVESAREGAADAAAIATGAAKAAAEKVGALLASLVPERADAPPGRAARELPDASRAVDELLSLPELQNLKTAA